MKKILFIVFTYLCLGYTIYFMHNKIERLNTSLSFAVNNEKAFAAENSKLK